MVKNSNIKIDQVSEEAYEVTISSGAQAGERTSVDSTDIGKDGIDVLHGHRDQNKKITAGGKQWASWGKDNKLPLRLVKLLYNNNLMPGALDTKDQITLGDDLILYYEIIEKGKRKRVPFENLDIMDWLEEIGTQKYMEEAVIDYDWFYNFFAELKLGRGSRRNQVRAINALEAMDCRAEIMDKSGRIGHYGLADWNNNKKLDVQVIPAYDPSNPTRYSRFVMHQKKKSPGNPYYPLPSYIGAQFWISHANKIPQWKTNNMDNQANIKYHIQIPERYFLNLYPEPEYTKEDRAQKRQDKIQEISEMLSGVKNPGKAFVSEFAIDKVTGKELPGWKIEAIANNINHEAYSKDFEDSNSAIHSSVAVDPALSGVMQPGKMGAGSGSEKRLAYLFHAKIKTRYARRLLLEPIQVAMKISGFDRMEVDGQMRRVKIGIHDVEFTTLDEDASGIAPNSDPNNPPTPNPEQPGQTEE
jgi:hypothetical protein